MVFPNLATPRHELEKPNHESHDETLKVGEGKNRKRGHLRLGGVIYCVFVWGVVNGGGRKSGKTFGAQKSTGHSHEAPKKNPQGFRWR